MPASRTCASGHDYREERGGQRDEECGYGESRCEPAPAHRPVTSRGPQRKAGRQQQIERDNGDHELAGIQSDVDDSRVCRRRRDKRSKKGETRPADVVASAHGTSLVHCGEGLQGSGGLLDQALDDLVKPVVGLARTGLHARGNDHVADLDRSG